jgi:hypothetical protein
MPDGRTEGCQRSGSAAATTVEELQSMKEWTHECLKERSRSLEQFTADHSYNVPISDFSPIITAAFLTSMRFRPSYAVEHPHTT